MIGRKPTNSPLVEEYRICNTPVIGAYMFWCFAKEYVKATARTGNSRPPHFLLFCFLSVFIADSRLLSEASAKKSILSFRRHLVQRQKDFLFLGIHERVREMLPYTLAALDICYACGILTLHAEDATVEPNAVAMKRGTGIHISKRTQQDARLVARIATWFAKCDDVLDVARKLEVVL